MFPAILGNKEKQKNDSHLINFGKFVKAASIVP